MRALQLTRDNLDDVADWCGGYVEVDPDCKELCLVVNDRRAWVGDQIVCVKKGEPRTPRRMEV